MSFTIKESNGVINSALTKVSKGYIGFLLTHNNTIAVSL